MYRYMTRDCLKCNVAYQREARQSSTRQRWVYLASHPFAGLEQNLPQRTAPHRYKLTLHQAQLTDPFHAQLARVAASGMELQLYRAKAIYQYSPCIGPHKCVGVKNTYAHRSDPSAELS